MNTLTGWGTNSLVSWCLLRRRGIAHVLCAVSFAALTACAGEPHADRSQTTGAQLTLADTLRDEFEGDSLDPPFQIVGAFFLADSIFVALNGQKEIRVYSVNGNKLRSVGRAGRGPGEFLSITWIQRTDSSFYVYDRSARRVSEFRFDGLLLHTIPIVPEPSMSFALAVGVFSDGSILVKSQAFETRTATRRQYRSASALMRYTRDGHAPSTIGRLIEREGYSEPRAGGGEFSTAIPLGIQSDVIVHNSNVVRLHTDSTIEWLTADGVPIRTSPLPWRVRVTVSPADLDTIKTRFIGDAPSMLRMPEVFGRLKLPRQWPQYGWDGVNSLKLATLTTASRIWVVRSGGLRGGPIVWDVIPTSLRDTALVVSSSEPVEILDESNHRVLVVARGGDQVELLQIRSLRPAKK